jgi:hypothetical protein
MTEQYLISPNPAKTYFVLKQAKGLPEHISLSIFSHEGLLFKNYEFEHPDKNYEYVVDIRCLPPGDYYLLIHSDNVYKIERIIKNR